MEMKQMEALVNHSCNSLIGVSPEETAMNCEKVLGFISRWMLLSNGTEESEKEAVCLIMNNVREALKSSAPALD